VSFRVRHVSVCVWKGKRHENLPIAGGFLARHAIPVVDTCVSPNSGVSQEKRTILGDRHDGTMANPPPTQFQLPVSLVDSSDCHGFQNPPGFTGRVCQVRVRVGLCRPSVNPYPRHGLPGYPRCDPSHQELPAHHHCRPSSISSIRISLRDCNGDGGE
jgi:hypothetical protein